jgi:hypothetical protein
MRNIRRLTISVTVLSLTVLFLANASSGEVKKAVVKYPEGYRNWAHVKSMVIHQGHSLYESFGGIHHVYANDKALKAMKSGKLYPDGAVLVFDLLEAKSDNNATVEGSRKVVGVMEKNTRKFAETGGWGFEGFKGDTKERVVTDPKKACFSCHEPQKATDFVFSNYRN